MKSASKNYGRKKQDRREVPAQKALQLASLGATPPTITTPAEKTSNTN